MKQTICKWGGKMIDTIIGAVIGIGSMGFAQYLNYVLSVKKEKRNIKIQSINRFKKALMRLRVHIVEISLDISEERQRINSLDMLVELNQLAGELYTLPETKYLAKKVDELIDDLSKYRGLIGTNEIHKAREKFREKIKKLQEESI